MPYLLTSPPAAEPILLADAKLHLRVDITDDDALISALITAARQQAEAITQRQLINATWKLALDAFPGPSLMGVPYGVPLSLPGHAILLNKSPITAVTQIQYLDMQGTSQTLSPSQYAVDLTSEPARVTPVFGQIWPPTLPQIGAVNITFTAGYGADGTTVPEGIKRWMLIRIGSMYEHREENTILPRGKLEPLPFVDGLLDPFKVVQY